MKNLKFVNCTFVIYKNRNKTSIQSILKLNSASFMFNKKICEMGKKVIHWGGLEELGNCPNCFWPVLGSVFLVFTWVSKYITWMSKYITSIYLDIQVYYLDIQAITTLLCLLFRIYWLFIWVPSIYTIFYLTTTFLKREVFWHSKAYSSLYWKINSFLPEVSVCWRCTEKMTIKIERAFSVILRA